MLSPYVVYLFAFYSLKNDFSIGKHFAGESSA